MYLHRIAISLAMVALLTACSSKPDWTEYQHPTGKITISFPTSTTPSGDGTGSALSVVWKDTSYTVSWADTENLTDEEFVAQCDQAAARLGKVNSGSRAAAAGLRGREYSITGGDGRIFVRYLRGENRVYLFHIEGPKLDASAEVPQAFLASFSVN